MTPANPFVLSRGPTTICRLLLLAAVVGTMHAAPAKIEDEPLPTDTVLVLMTAANSDGVLQKLELLDDDVMKVPLAKDMRRQGRRSMSRPSGSTAAFSDPFSSFGGNYGSYGGGGGGPFGGFNGGYGNGMI